MPEQLARDPKGGPPIVGMEGIDVPPVALVDQSAFIRTARLGLPGNVA